MALSPGSHLGPYEILAPIGAGGMGEVYRARDDRLKREVAIKVLPASFASDPDRLRRFEREARAAGVLNHPNITAVYDIGTHEGAPYVVQELLDGETLGALLGAGPLPLRKAVDYALQITHGLAAAHEKGIVHRDLKPENLFVTKDGRVKILDFGLALHVRAAENSRDQTVTDQTDPGSVMGTAGYMSPEQVRGALADNRSDIFSFGAILYEMVSGRRAFRGETGVETMNAVLREEPRPLSESGREVTLSIERIVTHCLEKKPDDRFQSARDLAFDLGTLSTMTSAPDMVRAIRTPGSGPRRAALAAAAIAAIALTFWAGARYGTAPPAVPAPLRFTVPPPPGSAFQGMLALSPDGRTLAFVATAADGRDMLYLRALDSLEARPQAGTDGAAYPFWSPDGRALAFFAQGKLKRIETSGGPPRTLCDAAAARGGTWGSGGTIVLSVGGGGQLSSVSDSGGQAHPLPHLVTQKGELYRWPSFLPDGRHFLYYVFSGDANANLGGIHVASLESKETTRVVSADAGAVFAPPGWILYRKGDRLMFQPFDPRRLRTTGEATPLLEDVWWDGMSTLATAFSVSSNGVLAYQTGGLSQSQLLWHDRSGGEPRAIGPSGAYFEPQLSPDARWIAVGRADREGVNVWMMDVERGSLARVSLSGNAVTPLWSADGRLIMYADFPSGQVRIREAHGAEKETLLYTSRAFTPLEQWSRDGRLLIFTAINWKTYRADVLVRDLQSGKDRPLLANASFDESGGNVSPDGRWFSYQSDESGQLEIYVRSFPDSGDRRQISSGGGTQARWRGDGKELFFISPDRKIMAVDVQTAPRFEAGTPHAILQTRIVPQVEARNHYDVAADGQHFLVNSRRLEDASLPITVVVQWTAALPPAH